MRKTFCFILACFLSLSCILPCEAAKSKPTATPPPIEIPVELCEPPEMIQQVLDLAYSEWSTLNGKTLKKANKYTKWRTSSANGFGWCGGFITWCMLEVGVPMDVLDTVKKNGEGPVEGIYHVKEASVGKLLRGYQIVQRTGITPQKGYLVVYGDGSGSNKTIHVGLLYDVESLGDGKYRLTTIEGNMSNRVKMYIHDYDMNAERKKNLSEVPKEERLEEESACFSYKLGGKKWYINRFLMPWLPEETNESATEE